LSAPPAQELSVAANVTQGVGPVVTVAVALGWELGVAVGEYVGVAVAGQAVKIMKSKFWRSATYNLDPISAIP
jgi:hypothetical protein